MGNILRGFMNGIWTTFRRYMRHNEMKKIFVAFSDNDQEDVTNVFNNVLETECGVECLHVPSDTLTVTSITEAVMKYHKTFVILTPKSLEKTLIKYAMSLALEKSQRSNRLCITLFLIDVDVEFVRPQLFGVLSDAMMVTVNRNENSWREILKKDMLNKISEDPPMLPLNVAANLSVGQAWSHFTGYGRIVLPNLKCLITTSKWYQEDRFPVVEFNFIPNSAKTVSKLTDLDERIKYHGDLEEIKAGRGSFADRQYTVPVYSITDTDGFDYFFVGQIPNTLSILSKLENLDWPKGPNKSCPRMTCEERSLQVARFAFIYDSLINHPHSRECKNMAILLHYDDSRENAGDVLLKAIEQCLRKPQMADIDAEDESQSENSSSNTVYIGSCERDWATKNDLENFMKENGYAVWRNDNSGPPVQIFEKAIQDCKWAIFIISKNAITDQDSHWLRFKYRRFLAKSVEEKEMRVIPIADGIKEDEISQDLPAFRYLSKQDREYKKKLLQTLKCESVPMECPVTAEGVHVGLAWAYVVNYLCVNLKDGTEEFEQIERENPECTVYKKMFIVIPSSCATKALDTLDKDGDGKLIDPNFEQMQISYKSEDTGGVVGREYQLIFYKITAPRKYIVAAEYPNAIRCLQEMSDLELVSGLVKDKLHNEAMRFQELTQAMLDRSPVANLARLLYYDDSKETVAQAMLKAIQQEG